MFAFSPISTAEFFIGRRGKVQNLRQRGDRHRSGSMRISSGLFVFVREFHQQVRQGGENSCEAQRRCGCGAVGSVCP